MTLPLHIPDFHGSTPASLRLFTSESVTEGHPDKICDQISDSILDALLAKDPESRVAVETLATTGLVHVAGEVTTDAYVEIPQIVRETILGIGYDSSANGFDGARCGVSVSIGQQSNDIAGGVFNSLEAREGRQEDDYDLQGAGDQGIMFGYASDETPSYMPVPIWLAHRLSERLTEVRKSGQLGYLRPDGKTQVTVEYKDVDGAMIPVRVHTVVISTQHDEGITNEEIQAQLQEHVIKKVIPAELLDEETIYHLNPSGRFVIGGPHGDAGLTGRKIIIDTYGGWGAHGGGAFSGKDPTKVDRSAAYAARWVAKSVVNAKLAKRCLIQLSYAIGVAAPLSINVNTYGTGTLPEEQLLEIINNNFDLRPGVLMNTLKLRNPIYQPTAAYGHFGRDDLDLAWETPIELKLPGSN